MTKAEIKKLKEENKILKQALNEMAAKWADISVGEMTIPCSICRNPYVFYPRIMGDQYACDQCKIWARGGYKQGEVENK